MGEEIRYFKDKGYAFVRYDNKESACSAIVAVHCTDTDGQNVKCSWGKENPSSSNPSTNMQMNRGVPNINSSNPPNGALTSRFGIPGQNPGAGGPVMMPGGNPAAPGGYQLDPQQMQAAQLAAAAAQNPAAAQQYYAQQQYYAYMYNPQYMQQMQQQAAAQQQYYAQQQGTPGYSQGGNSNQGGQPPYPGGYGPPQSH